MARTVTVYEPDDIDLINNPLHKVLHGGLAVGALTLILPAKEGETREEVAERRARTAVATFLSVLEQEGWTISRREDVPPAFIKEFLNGVEDQFKE